MFNLNDVIDEVCSRHPDVEWLKECSRSGLSINGCDSSFVVVDMFDAVFIRIGYTSLVIGMKMDIDVTPYFKKSTPEAESLYKMCNEFNAVINMFRMMSL